jgi:hypothetical protein
MPTTSRQWSLLLVLPALLGGCDATAGGPYYPGELLQPGVPIDRRA